VNAPPSTARCVHGVDVELRTMHPCMSCMMAQHEMERQRGARTSRDNMDEAISMLKAGIETMRRMTSR
jgi:hypothetical protein